MSHLFHDGEVEVQTLTGGRRDAIEIAESGFIRDSMPAQHQQFYQRLPLFFFSTRSKGGVVWASVACGPPGFVTCPDNKQISFPAANLVLGNSSSLIVGSHIGMLGIELHSRRRNRVNGIIRATEPTVVVEVLQSLGNCPKYIQTRNIVYSGTGKPLHAFDKGQNAAAGFSRLDDKCVGLITAADTFFLATASSTTFGHDMSHRGGPAGFVRVNETLSGEGHDLKWADYSGNNLFMSLGNLQLSSGCGLLFVDWLTGDILQLSGSATVNFEDKTLLGAQRTLAFQIDAWKFFPSALPIAPAPLMDPSPYNPKYKHVQKLLCTEVIPACEDGQIKTFRLKAPPAFKYLPGQFALFEFETPDGEILTRTWTISCHPSAVDASGSLEISVKRSGLISSLLHQRMAPGGRLHLTGVDGSFTPLLSAAAPERPILLLAAGIGITPFRAMLPEFIAAQKPTTLIYSVRSIHETAFLDELKELESKFKHFKLFVTITGNEELEKGAFYLKGRITGEMIQMLAPGENVLLCDVYMCGTPGFMSACTAALDDLSHPPGRLFSESFNF